MMILSLTMTNSDSLIQDVSQILYAYYKDRCRNLEKYTKQIIECVKKSQSKGISECSNVYKLDKTGLDTTTYQKNDMLLVNCLGRLYIYRASPSMPYSPDPLTLSKCSWITDDIFSNSPVSTEYLIDTTSSVYLVRK